MTIRPILKHIIIFTTFLMATILSYQFLDITVATWCRTLDKHFLDIVEIVTAFGKSTVYLLVSFFLFLFFRFYRKKEMYANQSLFIFLSVALSGIFVDIIKWIFGRYRPIMLFEEGLYGFSFFETGYEWTSFASGHTVTAFSMAVALSILYPRGRILFFTVAIGVAASRILLTSHFLSDVIFASYIGIAGVQFIHHYFRRAGWVLLR